MRRHLFLFIAVLTMLTGSLLVASSHAPTRPNLTLAPGDTQPVYCADGTRPQTHVHGTRRDVFCPTAISTATPQPTATATASPTTSTTLTGWHAPGSHDGLNAHEHGDAPPTWATDFSMAHFGHGVIYGGDETSGPAENSMKHQAFKGYLLTNGDGVQAYFRYHAASNPMDRSAQFHSYEVYVRDTSGSVSFWQGLYDTGDPAPGAARFARRSGNEPEQRPIILAVDETSLAQGIGCEQWYMFPQARTHTPEFALTICGSTYLYRSNENATAHDPSTWVPNPNGTTGLDRRAEFFWYPDRDSVRGWFCADPHGTVLSTGSSTCAAGLPQYIAPTLEADARVAFGVSRVEITNQRAFPDGGVVENPN